MVADPTFLTTFRSTKREKGNWHFTDDSVAFSGKGHHKYKYAVGHKAHSLKTSSGVLLITLLSPANISDQDIILYMIEELVDRYPNHEFSYIILDKGYDTEKIHHDFYEFFGIIADIIRKKLVYPKEFNKVGYPLWSWEFAMKPKDIDYQSKRKRYACFKFCNKSKQPLLFACDYIKEQLKLGYRNTLTLKTNTGNLVLPYPIA